MILADIAILIPIISILAVIPFVCYSDIKNREVSDTFWVSLLVVNAPGAIYLYAFDYYPPFTLLTSAAMSALFYLTVRKGLLQQADGIFLTIISIFYIINPWPVPHGSVQLAFLVNLITMMFMTAIIVYGYNVLKGNRYDLVKMASEYPGGVPFMLPISAAFLLTVMTA